MEEERAVRGLLQKSLYGVMGMEKGERYKWFEEN